MALLWALNPALLGIVLLVISRPRPLQNLLVYWLGALITNVPAVLIPLLMLNLVPVFRSTADDLASDPTSTARHVQLGMGGLALAIAALILMRSRARQRVPAPAGPSPGVHADSGLPAAPSPVQGGDSDGSAKNVSAIRRLIDRANTAWDNGSLWVALVAGMSFLPGPAIVLLVDTSIVASGASIGTQIFAGVVFILVMFAVFEITLIGYLIAPAKTLAVLRPLQDWALAHRPQVVATIVAVVGAWLVARGTGIV
ncbi:GAP family protein [Mycolicibacterium celeriflavum]|uniref:GAP family protein n=1 Tax=Mycolicibacterium celeriflavum TaxID=1249101 RepID=UPI003CF56C02